MLPSLVPMLLEARAFLDPPAVGDEALTRAVLWLAVILVLAKIGSELAERLRQPAVIGEMAIGLVLGNIAFLGIPGLEAMEKDGLLRLFARIGVLILIFRLGLRSSVSRMAQVGLSSLLVAVIGAVVPFGLGFLASAWLLPGEGPHVHAFLAATLTATGIGVIGRVIHDLGRQDDRESRVILGAAVIDDILGLTVMAAVEGSIEAARNGTEYSWHRIGGTALGAALFLGGSLVIGTILAPIFFSIGARLRSRGVLLAGAISGAFLLSSLAARAGISPIVGAFAAGLVLERTHDRAFLQRGEQPLDQSLEPISSLLVPVFFVLMGMRVDLSSIAGPGVLALTAVLTVIAVAGKLACVAGVVEPGIDRLAVGIGMVPRGALGLVFVEMGLDITLRGKPIITPTLYSAVVLVVLATTLIALPLLQWRLAEVERRRAREMKTGEPAAAEKEAPPIASVDRKMNDDRGDPADS